MESRVSRTRVVISDLFPICFWITEVLYVEGIWTDTESWNVICYLKIMLMVIREIMNYVLVFEIVILSSLLKHHQHNWCCLGHQHFNLAYFCVNLFTLYTISSNHAKRFWERIQKKNSLSLWIVTFGCPYGNRSVPDLFFYTPKIIFSVLGAWSMCKTTTNNYNLL